MSWIKITLFYSSKVNGVPKEGIRSHAWSNGVLQATTNNKRLFINYESRLNSVFWTRLSN